MNKPTSDFEATLHERFTAAGINVEKELERRANEGAEHNPRSVELVNMLEAMDYLYFGYGEIFNDYQDGIMDMLDLYFELETKENGTRS